MFLDIDMLSYSGRIVKGNVRERNYILRTKRSSDEHLVILIEEVYILEYRNNTWSCYDAFHREQNEAVSRILIDYISKYHKI